jgi:uncharacterized protein YcgI (DUF1989 family)
MSDAPGTPIARHHIEPQSGLAISVEQGEIVRIIDPLGEQVSDVVAFARNGTDEWLSSGRTIDYANSIYLTTGNVLYSNRSRPMFAIIEDTVGRHDFLLTPCSPQTFEILYGLHEYHPSCFENLASALAPHGVAPDDLPTTLNVFMNVDLLPSGELRIGPPLSRPGDHLDLRAEMPLIIGITACSAEKSNNGSFKPIDVEVFSAC